VPENGEKKRDVEGMGTKLACRMLSDGLSNASVPSNEHVGEIRPAYKHGTIAFVGLYTCAVGWYS